MFLYNLMLPCLVLATIFSLNYSTILISIFGNLYKLFAHSLYHFSSWIVTNSEEHGSLLHKVKQFLALYETSTLLRGSINLHLVYILSAVSSPILLKVLSLQTHFCRNFDCSFFYICIYSFQYVLRIPPVSPFLFYFANNI